MRLIPGIILLILNSTTLFAQKAIDTSGLEPKSTFQVNINGKTYELKENEAFKLAENFTKPTITIKLSDRKKFITNFLSFEYPRYYTFDYEKDGDYKSWTFTGNNITIMLFEFNETVPMDVYIDELESKFGKENCVIKPLEKLLGGKQCSGKTLEVTLAGQRLDMELYDIVLNDGKTRFLYFQNALKDDGSSTEEYSNGFNMINSTLLYVK